MSSRLKNFVWLILVLIVFAVITSIRGQSGMNLDFGEHALNLTAPNHFSVSVAYDEIKSLSLVELTDPGFAVNGDENRHYQWGTYENDSWGQYVLCVSKKIDHAILITMQNGNHVVFNFESDSSTESLVDMFGELLDAYKNGTLS